MTGKRTKAKINGQTKSRIYKIIGVLLILVSLGLAGSTVVANYLANQKRAVSSEHYTKSVKKLSKAEIAKQLKMAHSYNKMIAEQDLGTGNYTSPYKYQQVLNIPGAKGVIATLKIPSIHINNMPVYHTTSESVLSHGLGHWPASSMPVGGKNTRSVITGHSGLQEQLLFTDVHEMQKGDVFYVKVLDKILAYKVFEKQVVNPNDIKSADIKAGKDEVTLLTCTPIGINTQRLLVTGKRIPYHPGDDKKKQPAHDSFDYQHLIIYIMLALLALFIAKMIYHHYRPKFYMYMGYLDDRQVFHILAIVGKKMKRKQDYLYNRKNKANPLDFTGIGQNKLKDIYSGLLQTSPSAKKYPLHLLVKYNHKQLIFPIS